MDTMTLLALINLALGAAALIPLSWRTVRRRHEMPEEVLLLHLLAINLLTGLLAVSASQVRTGDSLVLIFAITVVKVAALAILWKTRHTLYRTGTRFEEQTDAAVTHSKLPRRRNRDNDAPDRDITA